MCGVNRKAEEVIGWMALLTGATGLVLASVLAIGSESAGGPVELSTFLFCGLAFFGGVILVPWFHYWRMLNIALKVWKRRRRG